MTSEGVLPEGVEPDDLRLCVECEEEGYPVYRIDFTPGAHFASEAVWRHLGPADHEFVEPCRECEGQGEVKAWQRNSPDGFTTCPECHGYKRRVNY